MTAAAGMTGSRPRGEQAVEQRSRDTGAGEDESRPAADVIELGHREDRERRRSCRRARRARRSRAAASRGHRSRAEPGRRATTVRSPPRAPSRRRGRCSSSRRARATRATRRRPRGRRQGPASPGKEPGAGRAGPRRALARTSASCRGRAAAATSGRASPYAAAPTATASSAGTPARWSAEPREEQIGLRLDQERVRGREDEVGEREQLEARIGKAPAEPREHGGLGGPRDDERRPVEELCERDGSQRRAGGDGERRKLGLAPPGRGRDGAVDDGRGGKGDSARVALEEDEAGEQGEGHVAAGVGAGDGVEPLSLRTQLPRDAGAEVEQAEDGRDDQDAGLRRLAFLVDQRHELRHADRAGDEEQARPSACGSRRSRRRGRRAPTKLVPVAVD